MILIQITNNIKMIGIYNAIKHFEQEIYPLKDLSQAYSIAKSINPKKIILFIDNQNNLNKLTNTIKAIHSENSDIDIRIFGTIDIELSNYINLNNLGYLTDIPLYGNGKKILHYDADIVLLSDDIDPNNQFQFFLIKDLASKFRLKIFGPKSVPFIEYLGQVDENNYKDIFASTENLILFNSIYYINQAAINGCLPMIYGIDFDSKEDLLISLKKDNTELKEKLKFDAATNSYLRYVKDNIL